MSTAANVRAGRAYVEVATDDAKLRRGLQDISTRLEAWSRSVTAIGMKAMAAATAIAFPAGFSIRTFAAFEMQMSKVAAITAATAAEVKVSSFKWTETHYFPFAFYSMAYRDILSVLTCTVNASEFRGWPAGTVLFDGAEISLVTDTDTEGDGEIKYYWKIGYSFITSPHVSDIRIGNGYPITKEGWNYLWVFRKKQTASDRNGKTSTIMRPYAAYVERVYEHTEFAYLLLPGDESIWTG